MSLPEPSTPSVLMTVQTVSVCAGPALLTSIMLHPAAAACTLTVYDNPAAASGKVLAVLAAPASASTVLIPFDFPINCLTGITCITTGTGAQSQVYYCAE